MNTRVIIDRFRTRIPTNKALTKIVFVAGGFFATLAAFYVFIYSNGIPYNTLTARKIGSDIEKMFESEEDVVSADAFMQIVSAREMQGLIIINRKDRTTLKMSCKFVGGHSTIKQNNPDISCKAIDRTLIM